MHGTMGGAARALALKPRRRAEIARGAARARWQPEVMVLTQPRDDEELECFVAQYGNGYAKHGPCDPTAVLVDALSACRGNACLARMMPVFIWRARAEVLGDSKRFSAMPAEDACALGYFLELTQRFGKYDARRLREAQSATRALRRGSRSVTSPFVFFNAIDTPLRMEHAVALTSPLAKSWNLVLGEPDESFESYFNRAARHAAA